MPETDPDPQAQNPYAPPAETPPALEEGNYADPNLRDLATFVGSRAKYYLMRWTPVLQGARGGAGFNWVAFFFSGLWLPYRKMYKATAILYGIIMLEAILEDVLFVGVLGRDVPAGIDRIVTLAIALVCGMQANSWYLSHARKKIGEIGGELEGADRLQAISQRGGTSLPASLLAFVVLVGGMFLIVLAEEIILYLLGKVPASG